MVERRLGRGLDFFLSRGEKAEKRDEGKEGTAISELEVSSLKPNPFQPRKEFSDADLKDLAESIRANGVIQPIVVRRTPDGHEIVAGERRWRAARIAGLERIPAVVRDVPDDAAAVLALVENVQRTDLNAIEKAHAFRHLAEVTGARQEELAKRLGLDRSTVANFIRLLELSDGVQALVSRGTLSMGHARAMLGLAEEQQESLADAVIRQRLSVREVEARVQALKAPSQKEPEATGAQRSTGKGRPAWIHEIEDTLAQIFDASVHVRYGRKRSVIAIECRGREEFERVYELLKSVPASK
jgi:ParB family chromosome partitioning protein